MDYVDRIIIPTDGSDNAKFAVEQGLRLAKLLGKPARALYVIDGDAISRFSHEAVLLDLEVVLQREATRALQAVEARAKRLGVRVETETRTGSPADEIVAAARPTDLIVISTHGRRGLSRLLLGSIAESVVRHAKGPVLVIRPRQKARR